MYPISLSLSRPPRTNPPHLPTFGTKPVVPEHPFPDEAKTYRKPRSAVSLLKQMSRFIPRPFRSHLGTIAHTTAQWRMDLHTTNPMFSIQMLPTNPQDVFMGWQEQSFQIRRTNRIDEKLGMKLKAMVNPDAPSHLSRVIEISLFPNAVFNCKPTYRIRIYNDGVPLFRKAKHQLAFEDAEVILRKLLTDRVYQYDPT